MLTVLTVDAEISTLRIHISPVGFDVDRTVLPAIKTKADRVWLIVEKNKSKEDAGKFIEEIQMVLKKNKIGVKFADCDREDLFALIKVMKTIFNVERKNNLYVNVSTGSKIQAIACTMSCMMFQEFHPVAYYVVPEGYHTEKGKSKSQSWGMKELIKIPKHKIQLPDPLEIDALEIIVKYGKEITKKKLAVLAEEKNLIAPNLGTKSHDKAIYGYLDKKIIKPLEEKWKYIKVESRGKNRYISLTDEGKNAVKYLL